MKQGAAHNLNNIGTLYNELGEYDEAFPKLLSGSPKDK